MCYGDGDDDDGDDDGDVGDDDGDDDDDDGDDDGDSGDLDDGGVPFTLDQVDYEQVKPLITKSYFKIFLKTSAKTFWKPILFDRSGES